MMSSSISSDTERGTRGTLTKCNTSTGNLCEILQPEQDLGLQPGFSDLRELQAFIASIFKAIMDRSSDTPALTAPQPKLEEITSETTMAARSSKLDLEPAFLEKLNIHVSKICLTQSSTSEPNYPSHLFGIEPLSKAQFEEQYAVPDDDAMFITDGQLRDMSENSGQLYTANTILDFWVGWMYQLRAKPGVNGPDAHWTYFNAQISEENQMLSTSNLEEEGEEWEIVHLALSTKWPHVGCELIQPRAAEGNAITEGELLSLLGIISEKCARMYKGIDPKPRMLDDIVATVYSFGGNKARILMGTVHGHRVNVYATDFLEFARDREEVVENFTTLALWAFGQPLGPKISQPDATAIPYNQSTQEQ